LSISGSFAVGDTIALTDGNNYELGSLEIEAEHDRLPTLANFINDFNGCRRAVHSIRLVAWAITSETDLTVSSSKRSGSG
jgi:flagellin